MGEKKKSGLRSKQNFIPQHWLVLIQIPLTFLPKFLWGSLFSEFLRKQFWLCPLELLMCLTFSETLMSLQPDALNLPCLIQLLANHYLTEGENVLSQMSSPCINFYANTPLYTKPYVWHKCADCQPCSTPSLGQSTQHFIRPQLRHNMMKIHPLWATGTRSFWGDWKEQGEAE